MKIYFLADTHLGMKGDNPVWLEDCMGYYNDVLIPYFKEHVKPDDILVHLGDVYDCRATIGLNTITQSIKLFEDLSEIFNDIRICVGNHDIFQKNSTEITSLHMLRHIPNIKIYFKPEIDWIGKHTVYFMPWIEDLTEQKKLLLRSNADYVFGHLEVTGCITNSKGTKLKIDGALKFDDVEKSQVFAGHIHIRQKMRNVHYVGTPYHKDRGDLGDIKGITVLDMETGETEFIENTYSPKFIKVNIYDVVDMTVEDLKKEWKNNYVDFVVKGADMLMCNFEPLREVMKDTYKEFNLVCDNTETVLKQDKIDLSTTKSSNELLEDYLDQIDVSDSVREGVKKRVEKFKELLT